MSKVYETAIIGAGGAGQMAILRSVLNNLDTLAIVGDAKTKKSARHTWVHNVENIPGMFDMKFPITQTAKAVFKFIEGREELNKKLTTLKKQVNKIEKKEGHFTLECNGEIYTAKNIVLCTGTMDVQPKIKGSMNPIFPYANRGDILYCIRCDGHKTIGKTCAVIGHDTGAGWIAILLKERYNNPKICILSNGRPYEGSMDVRKILEKYQIDIIEGPIEEILGDPKQAMEGFKIGGNIIPTQMAFVALGSIVHNDLAKQLGVKLDERQHILTDKDYQTNVKGFYAVGDLVSSKKKQVYTSWDMAVDAVDHIDHLIRKEKREE